MASDRLQRAYRRRLALFLVCVFLVVAFLGTAYQVLETIRQLDAIERERDQWQRPSDILQSLNVTTENVVADLGCGSGYFALKLSPIVGSRGRILAVDIRGISLWFLRIRTILRNKHNITIIHVQPDNPRLPAGAVDAVLVVNTFHELTEPKTVLEHTFRSLRSGGRLVVVDHGPEQANRDTREMGTTHHHEIPLDLAEQEVRQAGFDIISQEAHFIERAGDEPWWLLVAHKP
jgi:ubiquinone/menaquinone biosynthesis C-methylase UbiE